MRTNQRFVLNEKCDVTDMLNPANTVSGHYNYDGAPEDDRHLRECVLRKRLSDLVDKLIINLRPMQKGPEGQSINPSTKSVRQSGGQSSVRSRRRT